MFYDINISSSDAKDTLLLAVQKVNNSTIKAGGVHTPTAGHPHCLGPQYQGYTACKRTGFMKPDSVKLAKGHLLHDEAAH